MSKSVSILCALSGAAIAIAALQLRSGLVAPVSAQQAPTCNQTLKKCGGDLGKCNADLTSCKNARAGLSTDLTRCQQMAKTSTAGGDWRPSELDALLLSTYGSLKDRGMALSASTRATFESMQGSAKDTVGVDAKVTALKEMVSVMSAPLRERRVLRGKLVKSEVHAPIAAPAAAAPEQPPAQPVVQPSSIKEIEQRQLQVH